MQKLLHDHVANINQSATTWAIAQINLIKFNGNSLNES